MWRVARAAALIVLLAPITLAAHDIPVDVTVQAFVRPEGRHLHLLVRVPLEAMRDVNYPRRGIGYLDLPRTEPLLPDAAMQWIGDFIELYEDDVPLPKPAIVASRVAVFSDKSFGSYEAALAHVTGPSLPPGTDIIWNQGLLDVLFDYPIRSDRSRFSIHPKLARLGLHVQTVLRFLPPDGAIRAFEYQGDPGLVRLDPRWAQAAFRFVDLGFFHILDGTDHLLFLFCLVIPFRRFRALVPVVTSFTVAHSITLIASAYGFAPDALWFPPLIETLIAVSIVYMALENIVFAATAASANRGAEGSLIASSSAGLRRRWLITFGFGLVHGFGFSFVLRQSLQFAGSHLLTSLLAFNVGVELGQFAVLAILIPALALTFRYVVQERVGTIVVSALVAHTGWHWMLDRADRLRQFSWPELDVPMLVIAIRWLMAGIALAGAVWLISLVTARVRRGARIPGISGHLVIWLSGHLNRSIKLRDDQISR